MLFNYHAIDKEGNATEGSIDAVNRDVAIGALQRRGLVIVSIDSAERTSVWNVTLFEHVSNRDVVILSRQMATLFESRVSALRVFRLLAVETPNATLRKALNEVADDLQGGNAIAAALAKHPRIFSPFYTNMVRSGEESGNLERSFNYLADYLDRMYEVTSKARNALIYPAFVIATFVIVMALMFTIVIPQISEVLFEVGGEIPFVTQVIIGISQFLVNYGAFIVLVLIAAGVMIWHSTRGGEGALVLSEFKLSVPYLGDLYRKIYLARVAENLSTLLSSGIPMVRSLEITATVVGDALYEKHLTEAIDAVKGGSPVSDALGNYEEFPGIVVQMIRVGEESGELGKILRSLSNFYRREVTNAVDTLVNLIEPAMVVALGIGVGFLLAAVLMPIYSISSSI